MARLLADQPEQQHPQIAGAEKAATAATTKTIAASATAVVKKAVTMPAAAMTMTALTLAQADVVGLVAESAPAKTAAKLVRLKVPFAGPFARRVFVASTPKTPMMM
jgi:hypothetical protein